MEATFWFRHTHELRCLGGGLGGGVWMWEMTRLPHAGSLADQDAPLMFALEHLRAVHNSITSDHLTGKPSTDA